MPRTVSGLLATGCALALLASCSTGDKTEDAETPSQAPGQPSSRATSASPRPSPAPGRVQKLVTFVVENKTFAQMRAQMPWTAQLADRYGSTLR